MAIPSRPGSSNRTQYRTIPFLVFRRTEYGVGTVPFPRNETIPFRPPVPEPNTF